MRDKGLWDINLTVEATKAEAEVIFEALTEVVCGGEGEGEDHECQRDFLASMKPSDDLDSECVRVQSRFVDKAKRLLRRR